MFSLLLMQNPKTPVVRFPVKATVGKILCEAPTSVRHEIPRHDYSGKIM